MSEQGRPIAELERDLAVAVRRAASQHRRVEALGSAFDPDREANIDRQVSGAAQRLRRERQSF